MTNANGTLVFGRELSREEAEVVANADPAISSAVKNSMLAIVQVMFFYLSKIFWFFVQPLKLAIFLLLAGCLRR